MLAGEVAGVEIRAMRPADAEAVHSLMMSSLDEFFSPEIPLYFLNQWPRGSFVAADFMGNMLGYVAGASLAGGRASVALLCVKASARGRGIGSALLRHLETAARMEGMRAVQLEVKSSNLGAIRFYERRGFIRAEELPGFYNDGSDGIRMVSSSFGSAN